MNSPKQKVTAIISARGRQTQSKLHIKVKNKKEKSYVALCFVFLSNGDSSQAHIKVSVYTCCSRFKVRTPAKPAPEYSHSRLRF